MTYQETISTLQKRGYRLTKTRRGILTLLWRKEKPVTALDVQTFLETQGTPVNKTTVYRELEFLLEEKCIQDVWLNDGKRYYEKVSMHHHHIVCVHCNNIRDVFLKKEFEHEERDIEKLTSFKILHHSLEFFGVCERCR